LYELLFSIDFHFTETNTSQFSIKLDNISTADVKYHPQLSLRSIIIQSLFFICFKASLNSSLEVSQYIFNAIYQIFLFSSKSFVSIVGILTLALITFISRSSFSQDLRIFKITSVPAGHFICSIAFQIFKSSNFTQLASIIISFFLTPYFFAGEPFISISIFTQIGVFSTYAQIHSKSQESASLKLFASEVFINSLCLSQIDSTIQAIAQSTKSACLIQSRE
jgi:hypothetical protein